MKTPSTAGYRKTSGQPADAPADGTQRRAGTTRSSVEGETAPRLPHERDESSDSGAAAPNPVLRQAAEDAASGRPSTDRGEVTDELYERTLRDRR